MLKLAVNNTISDEQAQHIRNKALTLANIIDLQNEAEKRKYQFHKEYCEAIIQGDTDEVIRLTPFITELGGKIRAYKDCIELVQKL